MPSYISGESLLEFMKRHANYELEKLLRLYEGEVKRHPDDKDYKVIRDTIKEALELKKKK